MDTFYLVVASDRHGDDEYVLCRNIGAALAEAQRRVDEAADHYHAKSNELDTDIPAGWLFYTRLEDAFSIHVETIKITS